jgi:4-diphosphocytidyl-2-C-methyl-D-erythritol kinase
MTATVAVRSFAKINLGLYIGAARADGFHDLRTVYQTIALHDVIRVGVERGARRGGDVRRGGEGKSGRGGGVEIEILCTNKDPRVPLDSSNTCYRIARRVMEELECAGRVRIEIDKRLPVQGGLGAASSNAVATMVGLELALKKKLSVAARLRIAGEVGSDLPLFLVGGTVLGVGRGEEVYPLADLGLVAMVVVSPEVGVSTARAFADWDVMAAGGAELGSAWTGEGARPHTDKGAELRSAGRTNASAATRVVLTSERTGQRPVTTRDSTGLERLTGAGASDRLVDVGRALSAWLSSGYPNTGASAKGGSRVEKLLLDLVRTGIENDFERVVFPQYPELRDIKGALERAGAKYASLSGSGSSLYGLFRSRAEAAKAAGLLRKQGLRAVGTSMVTRQGYWSRSLVAGR